MVQTGDARHKSSQRLQDRIEEGGVERKGLVVAQRDNETDETEIDRVSGDSIPKVKASTIRRMLTEHGFRIQWIAEQLDVPAETVEQFAAELRSSMTPEQIVELLPHPVVELISELSGSDDPRDHKQVAEFLRETAQKANAILYARGRDRIVAKLPSGALDEYRDD
ncbi:hypothetical protein DBL06_25525 [Agrobacterium pusense]|nr:hypothetical protein DBL06_25525 [Agrobacterium pusense]